MKFASPNFVATASLLAATSFANVDASPATRVKRQAAPTGFYPPSTNGGSQLTSGTYSGQGEPLNVIISAASDAGVLTPAGFEEYAESLAFSPGDCLSISLGTPQLANLGDGNGALNQTGILRYNYGQGDDGTCAESFNGGNHFRYWIQNGSAADSGAVFLAASVEEAAAQNHMIVPNGYDLGRDWLVGNATVGNGTRSPGGFEYMTTVSDDTSLLSGLSASQINHGIGIDGVVKVLTVRITKQGTTGAGRTQTGTPRATSTPEQPSSASPLAPSSAVALVLGAASFVAGSCLVLL